MIDEFKIVKKSILNILAIYPTGNFIGRIKGRSEFPPHGPLYISAIFELFGCKVKILPIDEFKDLSNIEQYDIQAISILTATTYNSLKKSVETLKKPRILRILGGFQASLYPEKVLNDFGGDVLIRNEGELILKELIQKLIEDKDWKKIDGINYIYNGKYYENPNRKKIQNLDLIPFPARHLLKKDRILMKNRLPDNPDLLCVSIITSRGCPNHCKFCASQPEKPRYRSPRNVKGELLYLRQQYPEMGGFIISDETFTYDKQYVLEFCKEIKNLNLKFAITTRVDKIDEELLSNLKDAGCVEIRYGAESGSQKLLGENSKGITVNQIYKAVKLTYKYGIKVKLLIIHGLPGENLETTKDTIKMLVDLSDYIYRVTIFNFCPLPGSYIYKNANKYSLVQNIKWDDLKIHSSNKKWWGTDGDFENLKKSRILLKKEILKLFKNNALTNYN